MSGAHDFVEEMEHAAHGGHANHDAGHGDGHGGGQGENKNLGKYVGITMALLGVLLALCSAMVGAERTDLIATMVEQTNTSMKFQTISTKYRMLLAQLRQLHALCPDAPKFKKWDDEVKALAKQISAPDVARLSGIIRRENAKNLNAEIPTKSDLVDFAHAIKALEEEREAAEKWTESYDGAINAHAHAAEHYEWALLASEIGIVVASVALLFLNRGVWYFALTLGLTALITVGVTHSRVAADLAGAEHEIEEWKTKFMTFNSEQKGKKDDEALLEAVEKEDMPEISAE